MADELSRALSFCELVASYFNSATTCSYELVELCAGNGNVGSIFSLQENIRGIVFVDIRKGRGLDHTTKNMRKPFEVYLDGITGYQPKKNQAIVAVHACGTLTDKVLETASENCCLVGVMPCCYDQETRVKLEKVALSLPNFERRKMLYGSIEDYYDSIRTALLIGKGYNLTQIDKKITPMNNVIVGIPLKRQQE